MPRENSFFNMISGYQNFRKKYLVGEPSVMQSLAYHGQSPQAMVVACCDARVDPALILQCDPGDLFVVRNVANIVPPYECDGACHGTSAALEFGIRFLGVAHLILWGHSQCGGIQALLQEALDSRSDDFIGRWVKTIRPTHGNSATLERKVTADEYAKLALEQSNANCMTFPWIRERVKQGRLTIHRWFLQIETGEIFTYSAVQRDFFPLDLGAIDSP